MRPTAFNYGKLTGNMVEYKQCSYSLRKAIKQEKQGLLTIMDYKWKTSHVSDTAILLPDKLNTFTRFEDNSATDAACSQGLWALVLRGRVSKRFKRANPRKASCPDGIPSRILKTCLNSWL